MSVSPTVGRTCIIIACGLAIVALSGAAAWHWTQTWLNSPGPHRTEVIIDLPKGASLARIAARLENAGVIDQPVMFRTAAILSGNARQLKAGEYAFAPEASPRMILGKITTGDILQHQISIAEGLSAHEILALVATTEPLSGTMPPPPPEGSLLPETYNFPRGESRTALIARMQEAQKLLLANVWAKRDEQIPLATPEDALILASIVEKETGIAAERPLIAGVFYNRLRLGMALQSDPTVVYARDKGAPNDAPISRADLAIESPFNTYKRPGLPPAPIANPGRAALEAVLHPGDTDALYFVADGNGGHSFAASLDEHNKNVARLRAREKQQKNLSPKK
ncbi:MAG: endolytic transglycosylase MltG [Alphaproteobacteria bacterium]